MVESEREKRLRVQRADVVRKLLTVRKRVRARFLRELRRQEASPDPLREHFDSLSMEAKGRWLQVAVADWFHFLERLDGRTRKELVARSLIAAKPNKRAVVAFFGFTNYSALPDVELSGWPDSIDRFVVRLLLSAAKAWKPAKKSAKGTPQPRKQAPVCSPAAKRALRDYLDLWHGLVGLPVWACAGVYRAVFGVGSETYRRLRKSDKKAPHPVPEWLRVIYRDGELEWLRLDREHRRLERQ
jgi:hypothetical protein